MEHTLVDSGLLHTLAWDPAARTLDVTFRNGRRYHYADVDPADYAAFCDRAAEPSWGRAFWQCIRAHYPGTDQTPQDATQPEAAVPLPLHPAP